MHCGALVFEKIKETGFSVTMVSQKIGVSRRTMYNYFQTDDLSLEIIARIGNAIHYDFSLVLPEIVGVSESFPEFRTQKELANEIEHWKNKYLGLMEDYCELLEKIAKTAE